MTETEVDKYSLDCKNKHLSLKVCLLDYDKILFELTNKQGPEKYEAKLSLEQLCDLCYVFYSSEYINDALTIVKKTIESGKIAIEEKSKEKKIELELNINVDSVDYPPSIINLLLVNNGSQTNYKGDEELEQQNENKDYDSTEINSVVQSKVKKDAMELEYIQPILQLHYPDGTTKNTPLTPTLQGANGKDVNITDEQIKNIKEMLNRDNNRGKLSPIKDNFKRTNSSVALGADYTTRTMPQFRSRNLGLIENIYETKTMENDVSQDHIELNLSQDNIQINRSQIFGGVNEETLFQNPNPTLLINNYSEPSNYQTLGNLPNSVPVTVSVPVQVPVPVPEPVPVQVPYIGTNLYQGNIYSNSTLPVYQSVYAYNQNPSPIAIQNMYQPTAFNYIQENQYLPQPQLNMGYQQQIYPTSFAQGINQNVQNSMYYPKKYYYPKLKK